MRCAPFANILYTLVCVLSAVLEFYVRRTVVAVQKRIEADLSPSTIDERTETPFVYVGPCRMLSRNARNTRIKRAIRSNHSDLNACIERTKCTNCKIHQSFRFGFGSNVHQLDGLSNNTGGCVCVLVNFPANPSADGLAKS